MDVGKAKSELGWTPQFSSAQTLAALAEGRWSDELLGVTTS
jgi:nucleoside-diphosphate-sugar epimerase